MSVWNDLSHYAVIMRCPLCFEHVVTQDLQLEINRPLPKVIVNTARCQVLCTKGTTKMVIIRVSVSELNMTYTITALKS